MDVHRGVPPIASALRRPPATDPSDERKGPAAIFEHATVAALRDGIVHRSAAAEMVATTSNVD
ncbi:hypothetical protein DIE03_07005 [Burkholderia sp. Bp8992]|uniref:hypothetical protein n=1 Tax=Burkholderia sp. Bp8992 TaxID=2184554 RepID=UPI000F5624BC|nr:hypothetical protein [Burkholderia sp. Bp8992]RQS35618.1 hypothetical protein DIE03_07005 [Burkholderia sp. Bp8992]